MLKRKYKRDGYCVFYSMLELLGSSENHYYDMREPYERDYFIEYTDVDEDIVNDILSDLAEWGEIDKELYEKGVIWNQKFVDNITDVYAKRQRETPNRLSICDRLNIKVSEPASETPQSKVKDSKVKKSKVVHPLQKFIIENFGNISKLKTQLTNDECEKLESKYEKNLIASKLEAMENKADLSKKYLSVYLTVNKWCKMAIDSGEWKRKIVKPNSEQGSKPAMTKEQSDKEYKKFAEKHPELTGKSSVLVAASAIGKGGKTRK